MQNNATILIAAAFTMIGFALGRVTAPQHPHHRQGGHRSGTHMNHAMSGVVDGTEAEEVMVIVKSLEDEGFEGDTVFSIPGGQVKLVRNGGEMEVEVEMVESEENEAAGEVSREVVVKKQVIVVEADDR